jgi:hypothetical protein
VTARDLRSSGYRRILDKQGGRCAICQREPEPGTRLGVDHDHNCRPGRFTRGKCVPDLLCTVCNAGLLGLFAGESTLGVKGAIGILNRAIAHLQSRIPSRPPRFAGFTTALGPGGAPPQRKGPRLPLWD